MFKRLFVTGVLCISVMALLGTTAHAYPATWAGWGADKCVICPWSDWKRVANSDKDPTDVVYTVEPDSVQYHYFNPAGKGGGWGVPFYPEVLLTGIDSFDGDSATRNGRYLSRICFDVDDFEIPEEIIPEPPNPQWTRDPDSLVILEIYVWINGYSDLIDDDGITETETAHVEGTCTLNYDRTEYICVTTQSWGWKRGDEICPFNDPPQFTSTPLIAATVGSLYTYDITTSDPDRHYPLEITGTTLPDWLTLSVPVPADGTATLSGNPAPADVGNHTVDLLVTDRGGLSGVPQSFIIVVDPAP